MAESENIPVAVSVPDPNGLPDVEKIEIKETSGPGKALGFAARAVHADAGISAHRAVAPAMHVSTTFRYSDDPEVLKARDYTDVSL